MISGRYFAGMTTLQRARSAFVFLLALAVAMASLLVAAPSAQAATAVYNLPPFKKLTGPATGIDSPAGMAIDGEGSVYLTSADGNSVTVYAKGWAGGNTPPTKVLQGPSTQLNLPIGITVRPNGDLYVANGLGGINYYAAGWASGDTPPTRILAGGATMLFIPVGVAFDSSGTMLVTMPLGSSLLAFDGAWINEADPIVDLEPINFIAGPPLDAPVGLGVDSTGQVYVANNGVPGSSDGSITVYPAGWYNQPFDGTPVKQLSGPLTSIVNPTGLTIDSDDNLYVNNQIGNSILRFDAGWSSGDTEPDIKLAGDQTQIVDPRGTVIDEDGIQYVANDNNSLTAYSFVPRGLISPDPAEFGDVGINDPAEELTVSLMNVGTSPLTNNESVPVISGDDASDFSVVNDGCLGVVLTPTQTCEITVAFNPSAAGERTATLSVQHLDSVPNTTATLSGVGTTTPLVPQTITFATAPDLAVGATGSVSATSDGDGTITYSSADTAICTVDTNTGLVTGITTGTCTITATAAATANWQAGTDNQAFPITQGPAQTISFPALPARSVDDAPFSVSATATSGLPVTFSSLTPQVCVVSGIDGSLVTLTGAAGTCTLAADQPGDATYSPAPQVLSSFLVSNSDPLVAQTITFDKPADRRVDASPFTLTATATSNLPVTLHSTTPDVCTTSGSNGTVATPVAAGSCTITASQPGNSVYEPAPDVAQSFAIRPAPSKDVQRPLRGCAKTSKRTAIPLSGTRTLVSPRCRTNAGQRVGVTVRALTPRGDLRYFRLVCVTASRTYKPQRIAGEASQAIVGCKGGGALKIKTFGVPLTFQVTWAARGTDDYRPYRQLRTFRT